jgi:hypothetical protein
MFASVSGFKHPSPQLPTLYQRKTVAQPPTNLMLFAGSCCEKASPTTPPSQSPSSDHESLQQPASNNTNQPRTIDTRAAAEKTTILQTMRTHIVEWLRQFFSIIQIDLKALLTGKVEQNPKSTCKKE